MVIAERTTSYGFLAALCGVRPIAIAQQGMTDLWPERSALHPIKKRIQNYAFRKADLIHAWGKVMTYSMQKSHVDMKKVLVLPKGINLELFENKNEVNPNQIRAIVTRSLQPEYRHDVIIKAFAILHKIGYDFSLLIVGDGTQMCNLKQLATDLGVGDKIIFTGKVPNEQLPKLLQHSNYYISMPITEGVSASLFEAMATSCYPIVSDVAGNREFIVNRENGQLIPVDDVEKLAEELLWAIKNSEYRCKAAKNNRIFVEKNADYKINMKRISDRYHTLINTTELSHVRN